MLEGTLLLEREGMPPTTLKTGDAFLVEAGKAHGAKNTASTTTRIVATYIVEKGKPLVTPVP